MGGEANGIVSGNYYSPHCSSMYSKEGKKSDRDTEGNVKEERKKHCLSSVLSSCSDFVNGKCEIEFLLDQIMDQDSCCVSFSHTFTPKYHCKMASWRGN